ncbi:hypothetical protein [Paenibacillus sp. BJ-4]|uniref:hypothetical protein n=1 Tax=Paenibacillus sp. BJ-4 TaxID=2878097 RepID=UPI001CF05FAB|nr:hypothetical protein [Paenibacillus sp. BJ-4]
MAKAHMIRRSFIQAVLRTDHFPEPTTVNKGHLTIKKSAGNYSLRISSVLLSNQLLSQNYILYSLS